MSNNSASMRAAGVPQPFSDALLPSGLFFLLVPASRNAAAGWSEACVPCKAQRWERRLGGLLEGEGGGMKGWLQSQNHAAGCGGHDGARCELLSAAAVFTALNFALGNSPFFCHRFLMNIKFSHFLAKGGKDE